MPWVPADATRHTHAATDASLRRLWAHVANGELKSGKSDGVAVRIANGAVQNAIARRKAPQKKGS